MDSQEARRLAAEIERETGWRLLVYTRTDIERILERSLSDDEWERLTRSQDWQQLCRLTGMDYDSIRDAVETVVLQGDTRS